MVSLIGRSVHTNYDQTKYEVLNRILTITLNRPGVVKFGLVHNLVILESVNKWIPPFYESAYDCVDTDKVLVMLLFVDEAKPHRQENQITLLQATGQSSIRELWKKSI